MGKVLVVLLVMIASLGISWLVTVGIIKLIGELYYQVQQLRE